MQVTLTLRETAYIIETHTHTHTSINKGTKHPQLRPFRKSVYIYIYKNNIDIFANQT